MEVHEAAIYLSEKKLKLRVCGEGFLVAIK
jgi:hypothetical protein